jgi:hypothetical protein
VVVPPSLTLLASSGEIDLNAGETETITAGDYKYTAIDMDGNSSNSTTLYIDGHVRIYLTETNQNALKIWDHADLIINNDSSLTVYTDGDVSITNHSNVNNLTQKPKNFAIYSTVASNANGVNLQISGDFYGTIYAPDTGMAITNSAETYGSFVGKDFYIPTSVKIHYDEALGETINSPDSVWQETAAHLVP